jgi:hypothetical protein
LTAENFRNALVNYAREQGASAPVRTAILPCTLIESYGTVGRLRDLDHDPWFRQIVALGPRNIVPIAVIYVPRPRSHTADAVIPRGPNRLWNV